MGSSKYVIHILILCLHWAAAVLYCAPAAAQDKAPPQPLKEEPIRLYLYLRPEEMTVGMTTYLVVEVENGSKEQISAMLVKPAVGTSPPHFMRGKIGWELRVWGLAERDYGFNAPTIPYEKPQEIDVPAGSSGLVRVTVPGGELCIWGPYTFTAALYHDGKLIAKSAPGRALCGPMPPAVTAPTTAPAR